MRVVDVAAGAAALVMIGSLTTAPPAHAQWGSDLNGTYLVQSDGEWARTNDVLIDEQTVVETWTVNTTCISPIECSGTVTSDRGWTGQARLDDFWFVDHDIPNWMPCPDGSFAPGHQKFILWGFDPSRNERLRENFTFLAGRNQTKTASGACGVNKPLVIEMPVSMQKLS
jgi:hypothetical protein